MIDFKTFESIKESEESEVKVHHGGLLRKSPVVKNWDKIGVGKSQVEGLGVWAIEPFVDNEIVEEAPAIILSKNDIAGNKMIDYAFKVDDSVYAIALGSGCLYNHRNQPNVRWHYNPDKQTIVFRATRAIEPGEELFISYGKDYFKTRDISMKGDVNLTNTAKTK